MDILPLLQRKRFGIEYSDIPNHTLTIHFFEYQGLLTIKWVKSGSEGCDR